MPLAHHPDKLNLIARSGPGGGGLVLSGHADTVPYDEGAWSTDPFTMIAVVDVDEAVDFYVERLGFSLSARMGPPFAIVERDGLELWLSGPQTSAAKPMPDGSVPEPGGWNRLVLEVDDVAALAERLRTAGVRCRNAPLTGPGGTQVLIEDPAGNPVELFSPRG